MNIELDELTECEKCGIIFNFTIAGSKVPDGGDGTHYFKGQCPLCKKEFTIW